MGHRRLSSSEHCQAVFQSGLTLVPAECDCQSARDPKFHIISNVIISTRAFGSPNSVFYLFPLSRSVQPFDLVSNLLLFL